MSLLVLHKTHTHIHTQTGKLPIFNAYGKKTAIDKSWCYPTVWTLSSLQKASNLEKHVN
jgi:hypothetical protein